MAANDNDRLGLVSMTNEEHHADPAIGASGLKELRRSPAHYWSKYRDPQREPDESTPAKRFGSAYHMALFEPDGFTKAYAVVPEGLDRRSKEGKALFAEIEDSGREPIKHADLQLIVRMRDAVMRHPTAAYILGADGGACEQSMLWRQSDGWSRDGLICKIRPDFYIPPGKSDLYPHGVIVDLKTTSDAQPEAFGRSVWNYAYWLQAPWYIDGFQRVFESARPPVYLWLAQESDAPHAAAVYSPAPDLLDYGRREYRRLLDVLARCEDSGEWPAYDTLITRLEMPAWVDRKINEAA